MSQVKKYWWIKLKDAFMTSDAVDFLMGQKNGANYVVLYQLLCLKTTKTNGLLERKIGEIIIPYDAPKIQRECKYFDLDTVIVALELYKKLGLIYVTENGNLQIADYEEIVGNETNYAEKMRISRAKNKSNKRGNNVTPKLQKRYPQVNQEKEIRERDNILTSVSNAHAHTHEVNIFIPPTLEQVQNYCEERKLKIGAEKFFNYYHASNWHARDGNPITSWQGALEAWNNREPTCGQTTAKQITASEITSPSPSYSNEQINEMFNKLTEEDI